MKQVAPGGADLPAELGEDTYKEGIQEILQGLDIQLYPKGQCLSNLCYVPEHSN